MAAASFGSAFLAVRSAAARHESRGGHFRSDFPQTDADPRRTFVRWADLTPAPWKIAAE